jgi:hypothetical protein
VALPKEIHVEGDFARATIALDEQNQVRDARNWHEIARYVGGMDAQRFWDVWGHNWKVS